MLGDTLRRRRAAAQLLDRPSGLGPAEIVRRLLAVQAQELHSARLALRARGSGFTAADVDAALSEERSLVVAWLGRGTLHLVAAEDYPWLLGLTAPARLANSRRRLGQEGVPPDDAERAVGVIEAALADEGPLTRPELAERIAAHGIRTEGQATPHLLGLAGLRGVVVLGPLRGDSQAFALSRDWLGRAPPEHLSGAARAPALAELARRYLAAHAPAAADDLARWAGIPLGEARAGLRAIGDEPSPEPRRAPPRLLPPFDPYLLGWRDRSFAVRAEHERRVYPDGGILRATVAVDGLVKGTWSVRRKGGELVLSIDPLEPLARGVAARLQAEAADVARFEGLRPAAPAVTWKDGID